MAVRSPISPSAKDPVILLLQPPILANRRYFRSITGLVLALALVVPLTVRAQSPELESDTSVATAGFYQLRWFGAETAELEESQDPDFSASRVIYNGADKARVMSGKSDGDFYYRVRNPRTGAYSDMVKVTVRHHSLTRAFAFFGLGAVVFLATLLLIATGARGNRSS